MFYALLLLTLVTLPVMFTQPALSSEAATALVKETIRLVRQNYVFAYKADPIVAKLDKELAAGRYSVTDPQQLATRLTEDLQAVTRDKHMNVKFNPEQAAALRGSGAPGSDALRQQMTSTNYGIREMRVLPGKVHYVNISPAFFWDPSTQHPNNPVVG